MRGQLNIRQWEETASAAMGHVWFAGCESFFAHLISPSTKKVDNKRLAVDNNSSETTVTIVTKKLMDRREIKSGWVDTTAMLSDCLTKTVTSGHISVKCRYLQDAVTNQEVWLRKVGTKNNVADGLA